MAGDEIAVETIPSEVGPEADVSIDDNATEEKYDNSVCPEPVVGLRANVEERMSVFDDNDDMKPSELYP